MITNLRHSVSENRVSLSWSWGNIDGDQVQECTCYYFFIPEKDILEESLWGEKEILRWVNFKDVVNNHPDQINTFTYKVYSVSTTKIQNPNNCGNKDIERKDMPYNQILYFCVKDSSGFFEEHITSFRCESPQYTLNAPKLIDKISALLGRRHDGALYSLNITDKYQKLCVLVRNDDEYYVMPGGCYAGNRIFYCDKEFAESIKRVEYLTSVMLLNN